MAYLLFIWRSCFYIDDFTGHGLAADAGKWLSARYTPAG
jgi:hypothetical protein